MSSKNQKIIIMKMKEDKNNKYELHSFSLFFFVVANFGAKLRFLKKWLKKSRSVLIVNNEKKKNCY